MKIEKGKRPEEIVYTGNLPTTITNTNGYMEIETEDIVWANKLKRDNGFTDA